MSDWMMQDEEQFEAMLQSVLDDRAGAIPVGLEQRLIARFSQEMDVAQRLAAKSVPAKSVQFTHFGVLNAGSNSKGAFFTSMVTNVAVLALCIFVGKLVKDTVVAPVETRLNVTFVEPVKPPPAPVIKVPPPPMKELAKLDPPKFKVPDPVTPPPDLKTVVVPEPKPMNLAAPAARKVDPPPAPRVVSLANKAAAASVVNNDPHPSAVRLGSATSPVSPSMAGPAVSRVNMSAGMAGMPPANSGSGPRATAINMGNGAPSGTNLAGSSVAQVKIHGSLSGVAGGTGQGVNGPVSVQIAPPQQVAALSRSAVTSMVAASSPKVTYKPTPVYSAEAKALHLEGNVSIRIRVTADGGVVVLGVTHGLGHGLDESAIQAIRGTRFKPATNADGQAIPWEGVVLVTFQLS